MASFGPRTSPPCREVDSCFVPCVDAATGVAVAKESAMGELQGIARFTFRLHRRRVRALDAAARARTAALASNGHEPTIAYQIDAEPDPWIGYEVAQPRAEVWAANEPPGSEFDW